jgi:formate hydrogenlyase subunit 6/NADH:ubiquinone oxidoreductase subunit I
MLKRQAFFSNVEIPRRQLYSDAKMVKKPHVPKMLSKAIKSTLSKPATEKYPAQKPDLPERYRGEPIFDYNACIGCGLCARDCPSRAIEMVKVDDKKRRPQVNLSKCVFCYQCAETCPKKCITYSNLYELATTDKSSLVVKPKVSVKP